ncbi:hypothetical protein ACM3R2_004506, partial [Escherichia coli]|nr:hypothetical protein [Shigella flexneri]MDD0200632.1 hypothetical protein [Shigella flexneri]MDD0686392.1 hypothetical protein [Shigella sonnei]
ESGKGEALEIPHSPEKEPVSCLTDWHYSILVTLNLTPNQNHYLSHSFLLLCLLYLHSHHENNIFKYIKQYTF